jgi:hypothetical protein
MALTAQVVRAYAAASRAASKVIYSSETATSIKGLVAEFATAFVSSDLPAALRDVRDVFKANNAQSAVVAQEIYPTIKAATTAMKAALKGGGKIEVEERQ